VPTFEQQLVAAAAASRARHRPILEAAHGYEIHDPEEETDR
jgi:hypothetical protein